MAKKKKKLTGGEGWSLIHEQSNQAQEDDISLAPVDQKIKIRAEKRKHGKQVTLISGLVLSQEDKRELLTVLKNHCAAGGSMEEGLLVLQGEQSGKVQKVMRGLGYKC